MTLLRCSKCMNYTLDIICPKCGEPTKRAYPPRFSPEDKYGKYRRRLKIAVMKEQGR